MKSLIQKIIGLVKPRHENIESEEIILPSHQKPSGVKTPVSGLSIKKIPRETKENNPVSFIDGGNAEIIGGSSFSLHFIRISSVDYKGIERLRAGNKEYYCLSLAKENSLAIECEPRQEGLNDISFPISEMSISEKSLSPESACSKACESARAISELLSAKDLILSGKKTVVLDGSFQHENSIEKNLLADIKSLALKKNAFIMGFTKTTSARSASGRPLNIILNGLAEKKHVEAPWMATTSKTLHEGFKSCFVNLSPKSKHVFRVEYLEEQENMLLGVLSSLIKLSSDPVFPGYPYGLIDADDNARISNNEKKELLGSIISGAGDNWELLEESLNSSNAHTILDNIRF